MVAGIALLAAACGRNSAPALDDALKNDLALASQSQPYNAQQTTSPYEANYVSAAPAYAPRAARTVARQSAPVRRAQARRSTSTSVGNASSSGSGGYYPAPAPPTTIEKNTGRDAAIGAVAGAVIGATTSRNKVQGGLIGAAIGGILGGVVGNNVDIHKKTGW
ncbi:MAG: YMGG-like glycine zipper-containing protein [Gemmatimonadaceae bacterium]